jgi:hypothetical protein
MGKLLLKKVVVAEAFARKQKLIMPTAVRGLQLLLLAAASFGRLDYRAVGPKVACHSKKSRRSTRETARIDVSVEIKTGYAPNRQRPLSTASPRFDSPCGWIADQKSRFTR